jgi:hypothetical protein
MLDAGVCRPSSQQHSIKVPQALHHTAMSKDFATLASSLTGPTAVERRKLRHQWTALRNQGLLTTSN